MQSVPKLLIAGAAILLVGSIYYLQSGEKNPLAETVSPSDASQTSNVAPTTNGSVVSSNAVKAKKAAAASTPTSVEEILESPDQNPEYPTFGHRLSEIEARRNGQKMDAAQLWAASQQPAAWKPLESAPDALNLTNEERNDGREFITFSPLKLESLVAGDTLDIEMAQTGQTFTAKIDQATSEDDGRNVTWTGRSTDPGFPGSLTITKGDTLIVGGISTPDGHYELQVHGDKGWIVNSATIFKGVDQQIIVPPELLENPPKEVVHLPAETFGEHTGSH